MSMTISIQIRKKGGLTLPVELRTKYSLNEGDILTLIDLGDGSFLLSPRISQVDHLSDQVAQMLKEEDISLEDLLAGLDEERQSYYQEHYARD
jgi:bifunctional DNA-binding transcriptional regulator/antitoxin component of YhaV-PrlF toxin-antitoxin module